MKSRLMRTLGALALGVGSAGAVATTAGAQSGESMIRVAHLSPDAPAVDVYVNGDKTLSDVEFRDVSEYLSVPPDTYSLEVRPAGAAPDSEPVIAADANLESGKAYTVAAVGMLADIAPAVIVDDLSAPAAGKAKIRVLHAAPDVPAVDVGVAGQTPEEALVKSLSFPDATDYLEVDAGTYDLEVRPAGTADVAIPIDGLTPEAGTIYTAAAVGAGDSVTVLPIIDAAGMSAPTPSGGVETGLGGAAGSGGGDGTVLPIVLATAMGGIVLAGALAGSRRMATVRNRAR